jgi:hypothetical protein
MVVRSLLKVGGALTILVSLGVIACAPAHEEDISPRAAVGHVRFDAEMPEDEYQKLAEALKFLHSYSIHRPTPEMLRIMQISDGSSHTLVDWLEARIRILLGSEFSFQGKAFEADDQYQYSNPGIIPEIDACPNNRVRGTQATELADNLGSSLYIAGKSQRKLVSLKVPGEGKVLLTSPRKGIVRVSKGAYQFDSILNSNHVTKRLKLIYLLLILFHEAHHSDGNGTSLGFLHGLCPEGHRMAGHHACDFEKVQSVRHLGYGHRRPHYKGVNNGCYGVMVALIESILRSDSRLTPEDRAVLDLQANDFKSRYQHPDWLPRVSWDSTPEGRLDNGIEATGF